jgi:hypothetical protein
MAAVAQDIKKIRERIWDVYDRPARLYPGLIALSPLAVMILCLYGQQRVLVSSLIMLAASCGCSYALMRIVRNAGQRLQNSLFVSWGGAPTTQLLRHSNNHFDIHTKERFHKALSKGIGKKFPTPATEASDPLAADELYRAAAVWLIGQTRDAKQFPLVFKENVAFGFQRNVLGIKAFGIAAALSCLAFCIPYAGIQSGWRFPEMLQTTPIAVWASIFYSALILLAWLFLFSESALKRTAFAYAERLIQSLDFISTPKAKTTAND